MIRRRSVGKILRLSLLLIFSACTAAIPPQGAVTAAAIGLSVTAVATGKQINADKTIKDDIHDFGVRDTIYVSVKNDGSGSATLGARWTYQDQLVSESSQEIAPTREAAHEFHIIKATAWPKGNYRVVILLNGDSVRTKDFTVK